MPPDKPIEWSRRSKTDLIRIWRYYAEVASLDVADEMIGRIMREVERIGRHPTPGREKDEDEFDGLRRLYVPPYTVFFRVTDRTAQVARVIHEHRDFPSALREEN